MNKKYALLIVLLNATTCIATNEYPPSFYRAWATATTTATQQQPSITAQTSCYPRTGDCHELLRDNQCLLNMLQRVGAELAMRQREGTDLRIAYLWNR